jgi:hypothetical protein
MKPSLALVSLLAGSLACSGDLLVSHDRSKAANRIPIRKTETFVSLTNTQAWNEAERVCETRATAEIIYLPGSGEYYIGVDTGPLAKTSFSLEMTEAGTLKRVTLDSDPQVDETILAAAELAKALASATGKVPPPPPEKDLPPEESRILQAREDCKTHIDVKLVPWRCFLSSTTDELREKLGCPEP